MTTESSIDLYDKVVSLSHELQRLAPDYLWSVWPNPSHEYDTVRIDALERDGNFLFYTLHHRTHLLRFRLSMATLAHWIVKDLRKSREVSVRHNEHVSV